MIFPHFYTTFVTVFCYRGLHLKNSNESGEYQEAATTEEITVVAANSSCCLHTSDVYAPCPSGLTPSGFLCCLTPHGEWATALPQEVGAIAHGEDDGAVIE